MNLTDYIDRHAGETAWLFGKGQSFTGFDFKTAGKLRLAINDVIAHVPDCLYGFANDGVSKWQDAYKAGQVLFQPVRCLHEYDSTIKGAVDCEVVTFKDTGEDTRLKLPQSELAEMLTIRRGTLGSALQILYIMGVRSVYMVGFDGGNHHAEGYEWKTRLRHDHYKDYNAIRSAAIDAAFIMGISLKFHNTPDNMQTNGRVFVRILRNCFAKGDPYPVGEIASFAPHIANELIACRCAEAFIPDKKSEPIKVETAEAVMPTKEVAAITRKPKKGRK